MSTNLVGKILRGVPITVIKSRLHFIPLRALSTHKKNTKLLDKEAKPKLIEIF